MKVCWFGIYDPGYSRNKILIDGLRLQGVEVVECRSKKQGIAKYIDLARQLRARRGQYDVLFCAFPVHVSILLAYCLQRKPIMADAFVSAYESAVYDRKKYSRWHPFAWWLRFLDYAMVTLPDYVITDTEEHRQLWSRWRRHDVYVIPVGSHTAEFYPLEKNVPADQSITVQFHGSYIPLQGIDHIVDAVEILSDDKRFRFRFIGAGQLYAHIRADVERRQLPIEFVEWLSIDALNVELNAADIILGIFGDTEKTDRVVPNKVYQGLAVAKPVITKDTAAIRRYFSDHELFLCDNSGAAIADCVRAVAADPQAADRRARTGHQSFLQRFTEAEIGCCLVEILTKRNFASA